MWGRAGVGEGHRAEARRHGGKAGRGRGEGGERAGEGGQATGVSTPTALRLLAQGWPADGRANPGSSRPTQSFNLERGCGVPAWGVGGGWVDETPSGFGTWGGGVPGVGPRGRGPTPGWRTESFQDSL